MRKNIKKVAFTSVLTASLLTLAGCGGVDRLVKEAEEVEKNTVQEEEVLTEQEKKYEEKVKDWEEMYSKYKDEDIEEIVGQIEKENVGEKNTTSIVVKDSYSNPDELAAFTADLLFKYHRGDITGEDYVVYIDKYGSAEAKELYLTGNHEEDVELMNSVQLKIRDTGVDYGQYEISKPKIDGDTATFYRKLRSGNGMFAFYKTELVKENDQWYFQNDEPSVPVAF